jgi:hypothetical protein
MKKILIEPESNIPIKRDREPFPQDERQLGDPGLTLEEVEAWFKMTDSEKSLKIYNDLLDAIRGNR